MFDGMMDEYCVVHRVEGDCAQCKSDKAERMSEASIEAVEAVIAKAKIEGVMKPAEALQARAILEVAKAILTLSNSVQGLVTRVAGGGK